MKICLAQLNYIIGDFEGNLLKKKSAIQQAQRDGADLIIFSELSVCGYIPKDALEYDSFIDKCEQAIQELLSESHQIGIIAGVPRYTHLTDAKRLYNSALLLSQGKIIGEIHKTLLPTYDIFDEYRYFEPNRSFQCVDFKGVKLALTICEDLWNLGDPLYPVTPMDHLISEKPDLMINISGSPYSYNHGDERRALMCSNARKYGIPLIYVNQVGAHTDLLFDGGSLIINSRGDIVNELPFFEEAVITTEEFDKPETQIENHNDDIALIHKALVCGIKDYFSKSGFSKAILGLSGGIDSALVLALAVEALGKEQVYSVLMPSVYSSKGSIDDSIELCNNAGSPYTILPISDAVHMVENTLHDEFEGLGRDITEENMQARMRGLLLMSISNKKGHILLNTSNKSETAVGYATLYGDMCGGLSVIGDIYKTQVYALCRYLNRNGAVIPEAILTKPPSAELRPDQLDSDSLPPYDLLDQILFHYIENQRGRQQIIDLGFEPSVVFKVTALVDRNEYKRFQAAPILRISHKAFGMGRQMPLVARYNF